MISSLAAVLVPLGSRPRLVPYSPVPNSPPFVCLIREAWRGWGMARGGSGVGGKAVAFDPILRVQTPAAEETRPIS